MINKNNRPVQIIFFSFIFFLFAGNQFLTAQEKTDSKKDSPEVKTEIPGDEKTIKNNPENTESRETLIKNKSVEISLSAGTGVMRGHTTYQIGGSYDSPEGSGEYHFPLSELIFPLNTYMMLFETNMRFFENWKSNIKFQTNLKKDNDNMKDSDWGIPYEDPPNSDNYYWYGPDHLDLYSESETNLRAYIFDIDFLYRFHVHHTKSSSSIESHFFAGLGYVFQRYKFQCRLIRQYDYRPDNPIPQDAVGDGSVGLTYNVITHIPYIKLNTEILIKNKYLVNASIGYSPYTLLYDRDNHILRSKISKAECTGSALLFSLSGKINLQESVFIKLQLDYVSIKTEGEEKQYTDNSWTGTIDQKNTSERKSAEISIGYNF